MSHEFVVLVTVDSDDYDNAIDFVKLEMESTVLSWKIENSFHTPEEYDKEVGLINHLNDQGD